MEIQAQILYFLASLRTPALCRFTEIITILAESGSIALFALVIFWCIDKKKGFFIFCSMSLALCTTNAIKAVVRFPRPFKVLELEAIREHTATGYSFPSGHTSCAAGFYGAVANSFKKRGLSVVCAVLILLVGLSRMILGVHWPLDVAAGLIFGIAAIYITNRLSGISHKAITIIGAAVWAGSLILTVLLALDAVDPVAFGDLSKVAAFTGCGLLAFMAEEKYVNFSTQGKHNLEQTLKCAIGIAGMLLILSVKRLFPESLYYPVSFFRYSVMSWWAVFIYPWLGVKSGIFRSQES